MNKFWIESEVGSRKPSLVGRVLAAIERRRRRRAAVRELGRLNAHLLADIGIEREEITTVVDAMIAGGDPRIPTRVRQPARVAGHDQLAGYAG